MVRQKIVGIFMLVILLASSFGTLALDFGNRIPDLGNTNDLGNRGNDLRNINNNFESLNDFEFRFRDITTDEELERIYDKLSSQATVLKSEIDYLIVVSNQAMTSNNKERVTKLFIELSEKTDELRELIITVGKLKNKAQESNNRLMLAKSDLLLSQLRGYQLKMANVVVSLNKYYLETRTGSGNGNNNWNTINYAERLTDFMIIIKDLSNTNTEVNYEKELQAAYCAGDSGRQAELIFELSLSKIITKGIKTVAEQYAADLERLEKPELEAVQVAKQFRSLAGKAGKLFDIYDALLAFKPNSRACGVTNPISDADKDGITNGVDNCISTPNPNQADTDKDGIGDACDMVNNSDNNNQTDQNTVKTFQERFDEIEKKLKEDNGYEDDFDYFEGKYLEAKDDDDKDDLEKYEDKLNDLDDDLDNLLDDLKDLEDEVEEKNKKDDLLEDIADLQEDIENLRKEIDELLNSKTQTITSAATVTAPQNNDKVVVLDSLDLASLSRVGVRDTPAAQEESSSEENQWEEIKPYAWLGAGLVIVFAIIIFLAALLLL